VFALTAHEGKADQLDGITSEQANTSSPQGLSPSFNGEPCMSDRLIIDLWGASISAEGTIAITAAVVVVLAVLQRRLR
jgi:hypothetical protein